MHKLQETAGIFAQWESEFDSGLTFLKPEYNAMKEAAAEPPTAQDIAFTVANIVGADLLFSLPKDPSQIVNRVSNFYIYCLDQLRIPKKNLPKPLSEKLDKFAKDRPVNEMTCQCRQTNFEF